MYNCHAFEKTYPILRPILDTHMGNNHTDLPIDSQYIQLQQDNIALVAYLEISLRNFMQLSAKILRNNVFYTVKWLKR